MPWFAAARGVSRRWINGGIGSGPRADAVFGAPKGSESSLKPQRQCSENFQNNPRQTAVPEDT